MFTTNPATPDVEQAVRALLGEDPRVTGIVAAFERDGERISWDSQPYEVTGRIKVRGMTRDPADGQAFVWLTDAEAGAGVTAGNLTPVIVPETED